MKKPKKRFPRRELKSWLRHRSRWDHRDWEDLLHTLAHQGFGEWTGNPAGQDQIGLYLETNRR